MCNRVSAASARAELQGKFLDICITPVCAAAAAAGRQESCHAFTLHMNFFVDPILGQLSDRIVLLHLWLHC